jgi:predicted ATP-dependent Lon-type protease
MAGPRPRPWDDLRFGTEHARKVDRVAMVGEKKWQEWLTKIGSIFIMRDHVKYFDTANLAEAERWVRAG